VRARLAFVRDGFLSSVYPLPLPIRIRPLSQRVSLNLNPLCIESIEKWLVELASDRIPLTCDSID
jgi:hypothetical protein